MYANDLGDQIDGMEKVLSELELLASERQKNRGTDLVFWKPCYGVRLGRLHAVVIPLFTSTIASLSTT